MKKIILTIVSVFIVFTFLAQNKMSLGLVGGPNVTSVWGSDELSNYRPETKFVGGLEFQYRFTQKLSLVTSINLEEKGGEDEVLFTDILGNELGRGELGLDFQFITMPLLLRYEFTDNKIKPFVNAGVYGGYLIEATQYGSPDNTLTERNIKDNYTNFDFGVSLGIGFSYLLMDKIAFSIEGRNNLGLQDLSNNSNLTPRTQTNSFNILFGVAYRFGK